MIAMPDRKTPRRRDLRSRLCRKMRKSTGLKSARCHRQSTSAASRAAIQTAQPRSLRQRADFKSLPFRVLCGSGRLISTKCGNRRASVRAFAAKRGKVSADGGWRMEDEGKIFSRRVWGLLGISGQGEVKHMTADGASAARQLRDYQAQAIEKMRSSLAEGKRRPVLMAATGAGKTRVAAEIVNLAQGKGKRVAFCVPALSLIDQTVQAFHRDGVRDIGVIQADHAMTDWSKPVQICSIQTLERRGFPQADLVIVDECHRMSKLIERWITHPDWQKVPFIGLSATPWARGMGKLYDDLVIVATTAQLIGRGFLSPFRVFAPSHPDLTGVKILAGDYHEKQLSERMSTPQIVADVVETWIKLGEGRPTLCFAVDRAHAKQLQDRFETAGVPCGYQDAYTDAAAREALRRQFHDGRLKVVCNVGTLTTGVDWDVRCLILARPTRSEMLFTQIVGRALRTAPGKRDALILDHSDNHLRLGFVTDIHHDKLDDGKARGPQDRKAAVPLPKECPKCSFLKPAKTRTCPACGFVSEAKPGVEAVDGELEEMRASGNVKAMRGHIRLGGRLISKRDFFGQLVRHARDRGYNPGWAANQFRELTGTWPNHYRNAIATEVSLEVASWIRSRMIRYAKRLQKEAPAASAS